MHRFHLQILYKGNDSNQSISEMIFPKDIILVDFQFLNCGTSKTLTTSTELCHSSNNRVGFELYYLVCFCRGLCAPCPVSVRISCACGSTAYEVSLLSCYNRQRYASSYPISFLSRDDRYLVAQKRIRNLLDVQEGAMFCHDADMA